MDLSEHNFPTVLAAAKAGAEWAWALIFRSLAGQVSGYLASRGTTDPEDTASEVFLKIARHIHTFEGDLSQFRSWVFVIAHRRMVDDRRARMRRPSTTGLDERLLPPGGDVETEALRSISDQEVIRIFEMLPTVQRDVLALRVIAGLTLTETASVLGKRVGAVKAAQHRALQRLHRLLEKASV
ncbi:MAG: RNA polymerase sigma factor [Actinobacteria bacterium]|nr:RNA polymerase sigma factor [Actinomycetota bacterium]